MPHHFVADRPTVKIKDGIVYIDTHRKDASIHVYTLHNFMEFMLVAEGAVAKWNAREVAEVIPIAKRRR